MNKKDFLTLMIVSIVSIVLLIECWCGLKMAIYCLCAWAILSAVVLICVLKDYIVAFEFVKEDYTR